MKSQDFSSKSLNELVSIIEHPNDYLDDVVACSSKELKKRNHTKKKLIRIAETQYRIKCKDLFEGNLFQFEQITLPYSSILTEKRCRTILLHELKLFKNKRAMLNSGLNRYRGNGG